MLTILSRPTIKTFYAIKRGAFEASAALPTYRNMKLEDYIELHFEKRVFPLERKYTNDLQELSKSPFFTSKRELHFPSTFGWSEFRSLYSFLVYRDFDPTLASIHGESLSKHYKPGLPVILPPKGSSLQYLSTSIAAAQLGSTLNFKPLTTHALHRLNNLGWTTDNPIEALGRIYHGPSSPDSDLRGWVKSWLPLKTPISPDAAHAKSYPTNLAILKSHPNYKNEFALLREKEKDKKKELNSDIEAVEKQVAEAAAKAASEAAIKDAAVKEAVAKEAASKSANTSCFSSISGESCIPWNPQLSYHHDPAHSTMDPYLNNGTKPAPRPSTATPFTPDPMNGYPSWPSSGSYGRPPQGSDGRSYPYDHYQDYPEDSRQGWGGHL